MLAGSERKLSWDQLDRRGINLIAAGRLVMATSSSLAADCDPVAVATTRSFKSWRAQWLRARYLSLYSLMWDFLLSQINKWTTTTWSNVWVILPKPSLYDSWLGSWYEHPLQSICILQHSPNVWFYPCSYICNCLKMPKKSQINEYSDHPSAFYSTVKKACRKGWQLFLTCLDSEVLIKVASTTCACRSWMSSSSLSIRHFFNCGNMLRLALTLNHCHRYDFVAAKTSNKVQSPFQAGDSIIY